MFIEALRRFVRPIVGSRFFVLVVGALIYVYLYLYRLGSLVPGLSPAEVDAARSSNSLAAIWHDPIFAPHKLLQFLIDKLGGHGPASLRLASVIFAGIFIACFYFLCSRWFGRLIGTVCTILLASLPWLVLLSRSATPSIMLLIPSLILLAYYVFARSRKHIFTSWLAYCSCLALGLYVPGMVWVLLAGSIINRKSLFFSVKRLSPLKVGFGCTLILLMIAPLIFSFVKTPSLLHHWLLIPTSPVGISGFFGHLGWAVSSLFVRLRFHIEWMVGRQPVLTLAMSALSAFGIYAMSQQARQKLYAMLALIGFGLLATAANGNYVYLSFCLIPMGLLAAAGLRYLFLQWQSVFPRNPLPRYFAYGLFVLLATVQFAYGARATHYAWPHTPETTTIFVIK